MRHGSPEVEGIDYPDDVELTEEELAEERECLGHPCDGDGDFPHAAIGDVFYCDGRCRG